MNEYITQIFDKQGYTIVFNNKTGKIQEITRKDGGSLRKIVSDYTITYTDEKDVPVIKIFGNDCIDFYPKSVRYYFSVALGRRPISITCTKCINKETVICAYAYNTSDSNDQSPIYIDNGVNQTSLSLTSTGAVLNGKITIPVSECGVDNFMEQIKNSVLETKTNVGIVKQFMQFIEPGLRLFIADGIKDWEDSIPAFIKELSSEKRAEEKEERELQKQLKAVQQRIANIGNQLEVLRAYRDQLLENSKNTSGDKGTKKGTMN